MACFLVPAAEAVISTVAAKAMESGETRTEQSEVHREEICCVTAEKIPFSRKLKWLSNLLWGGSALLAFEHVWHGEVVPWFPFFTKAANPVDAMEMLREMSATGVAMAVLVTLVWGGMVAVASILEKKEFKSQKAETRGA